MVLCGVPTKSARWFRPPVPDTRGLGRRLVGVRDALANQSETRTRETYETRSGRCRGYHRAGSARRVSAAWDDPRSAAPCLLPVALDGFGCWLVEADP